MSPNQGRRRPTSKQGGTAGPSRRRVDPAAQRRLGLLVFGVTFVLLFVIVAIAEGLGDPSIPSGDIILVEDAPGDTGNIDQAAFDRALLQSAAAAGEKGTPKPGDKKFDELKEAALTSILDMVWIQGEAEELGIVATDQEIAKEFKKLKSENFKTAAEYEKFLQQSKYTQKDVDERVKLQILGTKVQEAITEGVSAPSDDEIENYYEAAKETQFTQKPTVDVRLISNKDVKKVEAAKKALEADDSAKSWSKIAKKYSEDPLSKSKGGLQKALAEETLEEPLNAQIFETPEKQLTGPVKTPRTYYLFEVENSTPESVQELADVETQIKSQLEQQRQQEAFTVFLGNYSTKWTARTFCDDEYLIDRCANFEADGRPEGTPPACFEESPKGGLPEACPAAVFQLVPAQPGSVTPLEPRGKPLAQRPHPAGGETQETATATESLPIPTP